MNRIDRLMNLLLTLQSKKYITAEALADKYELSIRTIYRDIKALNEIGVPIYYESNKGYMLVEGYFLPPLTFTPNEANALLLTQSLANKFGDHEIAKKSQEALDKIKAVLKYRDWKKFKKIESTMEVYIPPNTETSNNFLSKIQNAIVEKKVLQITYVDNKNNSTNRKIEPIGIIFYTNQWHLIGYCYLREDYRDFKINSITKLHTLNQQFKIEHTYTIQDYMKIF